MTVEVYAAHTDTLGEGPLWSESERTLYWLDIAQRSLYRQGLSEPHSRRWALPGYPGCVAELAPGVVAVAMGDGIQRLTLDSGAIALLCPAPARRAETRFNDGKVDPQGRLWVGTMQNNFGTHGESLPITRTDGALYRFDRDGSPHTIEENIGISNTLAWSPDSQLLYFADSVPGSIYVYDFDLDSGRAHNKRMFFKDSSLGIPDGSAIDVDGGLWNARWDGGALLRITPGGTVDQRIELPVPRPTSCIFGGPGFRTLFVTSARHGLSPQQLEAYPLSGSVLALDGVGQGLPVPPFAVSSVHKVLT